MPRPRHTDAAPLNVYVDDDAGNTYRVCFVTGNLDTVSGWFVQRHTPKGDAPCLDQKGRKARQLKRKAIARAKVKAA